MTPAQRSVLAKGPNFAVSPKQPPNLEYITAIEAACTKLSQQDTVRYILGVGVWHIDALLIYLWGLSMVQRGTTDLTLIQHLFT